MDRSDDTYQKVMALCCVNNEIIARIDDIRGKDLVSVSYALDLRQLPGKKFSYYFLKDLQTTNKGSVAIF